MRFDPMDDVYKAFVDMHGRAAPVRTREDLRHVLYAVDLAGPDGHQRVTKAHLDALFECMWAWDSDVPDDLAVATLRRIPDA
jgi:hypothetical protein